MAAPHLRRIAVALAAAVSVGVAGCGSDTSDPEPTWVPSDIVLARDQLPTGYVSQSVNLNGIIAENRDALGWADTSTFVPAQCKPTADATLNNELSESNSAAIVAAPVNSQSVSFVEIVSSAIRDVAADRAQLTGACAHVVATLTSGVQRGGTVTTDNTALALPALDGVVAVAAKTITTTAIPDNPVHVNQSLVGYAVVQGQVTVQLVANAPPNTGIAPDDFVILFRKAIGLAQDALAHR